MGFSMEAMEDNMQLEAFLLEEVNGDMKTMEVRDSIGIFGVEVDD